MGAPKRAAKNQIVMNTQEVRTIDTSLMGKDEVFRMLALAESTGLPLLLVGSPGVGKTKTVIDYAKAWLGRDGKLSPQDFMEKLFILETDEGTKASEVKGVPDLTKLFTENKYELATPIANAEIVVINEVDKASSGIRNALLGVMNEKFLFNGKHKIPCKWKIFIATCNEIPKEEVNSPFWDRFVLKLTVPRVSAGEMLSYFTAGGRSFRTSVQINVPSRQEMDQVVITPGRMDKFLNVAYNLLTDRTLTFAPMLTQAAAYIWNLSVDKALVKVADIMINKSASGQLMNMLVSKEVKALTKEIDALYQVKDPEALELAISRIEMMANGYAQKGVMDAEQMEEIESALNMVLSKHELRTTNDEIDQKLKEAIQALDEVQVSQS